MPAMGPINDETSVIEQLLADADPVNGGDAAVLDLPGANICISTDSTVSGVHAPRGTSPFDLGRRAVGRALSDLAAMGAAPVAITCAALVPAHGWTDAVEALAGARERARSQGARLVGGDLAGSGGGPLALIVTVVGMPSTPDAQFASRRGARAGHQLWVTGTLGAATGALLRGDPTLPEPPDRLATGAILARHASAMIDLSDGVARDIGHLTRASACDLTVDLDLLPLAAGAPPPAETAVNGDDYELLFSLDPMACDALRDDLRDDGIEIRLTRIGSAADGPGAVSFTSNGRAVTLGPGFSHG